MRKVVGGDGVAPRQRGDAAERRMVALLVAGGLKAKRVPLSGSAPGFDGDILVETRLGTLQVENKWRRKGNTSGTARVRQWLGQAQGGILTVMVEGEEPIAVLSLSLLLRLLA